MTVVPKWLIRAGSVLVILGFFLPAVSCTTLGGLVQTPAFSINDIAQLNRPLLYLVLLGALAGLIAALIPTRDRGQDNWLLITQSVGLGLGALCILGTILTLSSQLGQLGANIGPDYGLFVLLLGYGLAGTGVIIGFLQNRQAAYPSYNQGGPPRVAETGFTRQASPARPEISGARLELVRGNAPSPVLIQGNDFMIGRSHRNHLVLSDSVASGQHVRLRYSQGVWFIQDQNSSNGTFVNGKRITAQRLNDGDQIKMGETIFIFHS